MKPVSDLVLARRNYWPEPWPQGEPYYTKCTELWLLHRRIRARLYRPVKLALFEAEKP